MSPPTHILVVDADERVHGQLRDAFRELGPQVEARAVFGGDDAVREVDEARAAGRSFAIAFVAVDSSAVGLETVVRIWQCQPELEVVLCGDCDWTEALEQLATAGCRDRLLMLRKPFAVVEARQLTACLAEKWQRGRTLDDRLRDIDLAVRIQVESRLQEHEHHDAAQRRSQRLEALGRLAAGLAHEINTPTQYASASMEFIAEVVPMMTRALRAPRTSDPNLDDLVAELPRAIEDARHGIERIGRIVKTVRSHAHLRDREGVVPVDVNEQVEGALELACSEYKYVADTAVDLGEVPRVMGDPGDLMLAILNLVINAAHAIRDHQATQGLRGVIAVTTRAREHHVEIAIADTGGGIPPAIRERVFEPFFTTKAIGQGTGQGLSIARATIVERHHGRLSFESEVGRTVFTILLPRIAAEDAE